MTVIEEIVRQNAEERLFSAQRKQLLLSNEILFLRREIAKKKALLGICDETDVVSDKTDFQLAV